MTATSLDGEALGRSRGGLGTKVHAVCDGQGMPLQFILTPAQHSDTSQLPDLLNGVRVWQPRGRPRSRPQAVTADKAYDSVANRMYLRKRAIRPVIPDRGLAEGKKRRRRGPKPSLDRVDYRRRNTVERMFGWLKECRRIATRYEKKAAHFLSMVKLGASRLLLRRYFSDSA